MEIETMAKRGQMEVKTEMADKQNKYFVSERYVEATRVAIAHARCEALQRNAEVITAADLLAGLGYEEDSRAQRTGLLKANAWYLRWLSGLPQLPSPTAGGNCEDEANQLELDLDAKRALAFAVLEADRDREYWIDTDHLLRGLLRFPNKAHFAVLKTELNLHAVRVASRRDREEFPPHETPSLKVVEYLVRKHFALWIPPALSLACYLYILIQSMGPGIARLAR
jgi:hypothetical protein